MFDRILFVLIILGFPLASQSQRHSNLKRLGQHMLSAALAFPKVNRTTEHYSTLAPEVIVFPKRCYHHELKASTKEKAKIRFISLESVKFTERNIFTNKKFLALSVSTTSHENTATHLFKKNKESH